MLKSVGADLAMNLLIRDLRDSTYDSYIGNQSYILINHNRTCQRSVLHSSSKLGTRRTLFRNSIIWPF